MAVHMQNPGWQAGASRNQLGGWLHLSLTAWDRRAQMLASRFCLSPSMAQQVSWLHFGESSND